MKIECDKCSAKYSIADEKVRGKTFKIRCKKCSNVIIVRDKASAAVAATSAAAVGSDVDTSTTAPGWHLAINGETVGPMPEDEVRQRYDAGEIDKETAVWQEGFEDWVSLSDVPSFADLPDREPPTTAVPPADDPFASANQDDYAGGGGVGGGVGAAVADAGAANEPLMDSPRVSKLTGQRNENSVLFSLDSLQALATGGGGGGGAAAAAAPAGRPAQTASRSNQAAGTKGLATAAPSSEGSGLIDIRALGAMVGDPGGGAGAPAAAAVAAAPAADDTALPSFGGSSLGGLAAAPLVAAPPKTAGGPPPTERRSNVGLYLLLVVLIVAIVGLGALFVLQKPETIVVTKDAPNEAPSVKASKDDEDKDKDKDKDDEDKDKDDEDKDKDDDAKAGDDAAADTKDTAAVAGKGRSGGKRSGGKRSGGKRSGGGSSSPPPPKPSSGGGGGGGGGDLDVDCILNPDLKKCKGGGSKKKKKPSGRSSNPNLPETLSQSDIRAGISPVKASAKSCGAKHGGKGQKVKVKLSISGATGTVSAATPQAPHAGTPLGNCVAKALKKARFKKFRKGSIGALYPIKL